MTFDWRIDDVENTRHSAVTMVNPEQLWRELDLIKAMIQEVADLQNAANGRLRKTEVKVAIIWAVLALLGTSMIGIGVPVALALSGH